MCYLNNLKVKIKIIFWMKKIVLYKDIIFLSERVVIFYNNDLYG